MTDNEDTNELYALPALEQLLPWLTQAPALTTYRVNVLKMSVENFKELIQQLLAVKYKRPPRVFTMMSLPEVVFIDAVQGPPPIPNECLKEVVVDSGCAAAVLRGAHIYAPGILAMQSGAKLGEKVSVYCDLTSNRLMGTITHYESPYKVFIGIGCVLKQQNALFVQHTENKMMSGIAIEMVTTISRVPPLGNLSSCMALLQSVPSIVAVHVLDPQQGERILEMCASRGQQATHIAELIADKGIIVALDRNEQKIKRICENIWQNGLESVAAFAYDSTKALAGEHEIGNNFKNSRNLSPPYAAECFDRILLQAPSTDLGNRPLLHCTLSAAQLHSYLQTQKQFIGNAVPLLREKGVFVYCTCTITEEENEAMVAWILEKYPQMQLVAAFPKHGGDGLPNAGLTLAQRKLVQRFGPTWYNYNSHVDTIGYFIAKFIKNTSNEK